MWQSLKSPAPVPKGLLFNIVTFLIALVVVGVIVGTLSQSGSHNSTAGFAMAPSIQGMYTKGVAGNSLRMTTGSYAVDVGTGAYATDELIPSPIMPPTGSSNAGSPSYPVERKVIRSGSLALLVNDVDAAATRINEIAAQMEGFVDSQYISQYSASQKSGSMSIRVPSEHFADTVSAVKKLAVRVTNDQVSSSDVSTQFVDLESDIKNYKVEEAQYQDIMKRAGKVSDVLEVARALAQVRGNIERAQGQMNYLSRQVAMSSITISLQPVADVQEVTTEWRPMLVAKSAFKNLAARATNLVDMVISFIIGDLPILILDLALFFLVMFGVWKIARFTLRKVQDPVLPPKV